jgi:hypothetical protein
VGPIRRSRARYSSLARSNVPQKCWLGYVWVLIYERMLGSGEGRGTGEATGVAGAIDGLLPLDPDD